MPSDLHLAKGWLCGLIVLATGGALAGAQASDSLSSLKGVSVPTDSDISQFIRDYDELVVLGKAFFWDTQAGVDGVACATCHFHAGADSRVKNQISPHGASRTSGFDQTRSGGGGANYQLETSDWPLFELYDKSDRDSGIRFDTDDVISSQGIFKGIRDNVSGDGTGGDEECTQVYDSVFNVDGTNTRRVEPRNAPSVINSGFAFRLFWDGRANNRFNGVDPFGRRNHEARVLRSSNGGYQEKRVDFKNSALASLAVGPPLSLFEMNCEGREFKHIGRKLLNTRPLLGQEVHPHDSVLGGYANSGEEQGLTKTYGELIEDAFKSEWWNGSSLIDGFSQVEVNFTLFWGLALQAYQTTLVSDDAPLDRLLDGESEHGMSQSAIRGMSVFLGDGKCIACHKGPDLTAAGFVLQSENEEGGLVERMTMGESPDSDGHFDALYDNGFYNIGVTPAVEDVGVGGLDPWGNPLSFTLQEKLRSRDYYDVPAENAKWCANHGGTCHIPTGARATVWYGSYEAKKWNVLVDVSGDKVCRNVPHGWGDPAPGYTKHCRFVVNEFSTSVPSNRARQCAGENQTCRLPQGTTAIVWYGSANTNSWTAISEVTGDIACSNALFGDPALGRSKICLAETLYMDTLDQPAVDAKQCGHYRLCNVGSHVPNNVWYGSGNNWTLKTNVTGTFICSGTFFGVWSNWSSSCRYQEPMNYAGPTVTPFPPDHAVHCASQGESCEIPSGDRALIWYGADDRWTVRSDMHGSVSCSNDVFPDAAENSSKSCRYVLYGPDPIFVDSDKFEVESGKRVDPYERDAVDGSFKTPSLRNVELTGPYFHNGGQLTLRQVVEFYNRGGDRQRTHVNSRTCDTTGVGNDCSNLDPDIESLHLSESQLDDLVAFMQALTDERVRREEAPFDHPALPIAIGHIGDENSVETATTASGGTVAEDDVFVMPAVGRDGRTADGRRPIPRFDELVSCASETSDVVSCYDEAYNSTDYVAPEPPGPSAQITYARDTPNYFLFWIRDWTLRVNGLAEHVTSVSIYAGGSNGECNGALLGHSSVNSNGEFSAQYTRNSPDAEVCVAAAGSRVTLATRAIDR